MEHTIFCPISENYKRYIKKNPHTGQFLCNYKDCIIDEEIRDCGIKCIRKYTDPSFEGIDQYDIKKNTKVYKTNELKRILNKEYPEMDYIRRKQLIKTTIEWRERGLLIEHIEFLTNYTNQKDGIVLIYFGNKNLNHLLLLHDMFPMVYFYLFTNENTVCDELKNEKGLEINYEEIDNEFMRELKRKYRDNKIYMICDIQLNDGNVDKNMLKQEKLFSLIQPECALLNFKLPYSDKKSSLFYMDGILYFPVWGNVTTMETRLVVKKDNKRIKYDTKKYENQMYYFNRYERSRYYKHWYCKAENMDHCYDCAAEFITLRNYLEIGNDMFKKMSMKDVCETISKRLVGDDKEKIKDMFKSKNIELIGLD